MHIFLVGENVLEKVQNGRLKMACRLEMATIYAEWVICYNKYDMLRVIKLKIVEVNYGKK